MCRSSKPIILITIGDPSGIGPEVVVKALADPKICGLASFLVIGDGFTIRNITQTLKSKNIKLNIIGGHLSTDLIGYKRLNLLDLSNVSARRFRFGRLDPRYGRCALDYIDEALRLLKASKADALVTAPVNKSSIEASGPKFSGHTEYLARRTSSRKFAMMLVGGSLRVTLVTRHIPLAKVASSLRVDSICSTIELTYKSLKRDFKIKNPRIGVAGLNPHAGDSGLFGNEEDTIRRAIGRLTKAIKGLDGPRPPDSIFHEAHNGKYDCVVAMYHDQGLIPFKMLYFENGVNLTLGLPFVRTSPDHGTAFDIAGKGIANPDSMKEAIRLAVRLL